MIRALRNLGRVIRIGRTLARHDALFPLDAAGLPPTARAEEIDVPGFCALARAYSASREPGATSGSP